MSLHQYHKPHDTGKHRTAKEAGAGTLSLTFLAVSLPLSVCCVCVSLSLSLSLSPYTNTQTCMYVYVYVGVCTYIYIYTHIYIYIHVRVSHVPCIHMFAHKVLNSTEVIVGGPLQAPWPELASKGSFALVASLPK